MSSLIPIKGVSDFFACNNVGHLSNTAVVQDKRHNCSSFQEVTIQNVNKQKDVIHDNNQLTHITCTCNDTVVLLAAQRTCD